MKDLTVISLFQGVSITQNGFVFLSLVCACATSAAILVEEGWRKDNMEFVIYSIKVSILASIIGTLGLIENVLAENAFLIVIPAAVLLVSTVVAITRCRAKMNELTLAGQISSRLGNKQYCLLEATRRPVVEMLEGGKLLQVVAVGILPVDDEQCAIEFACAGLDDSWANSGERTMEKKLEDEESWYVLGTRKQACPFKYKEVLGELLEYFGKES